MFGNLAGGGGDGDGDGEETFVWGTAVSVRDVSRKFKSFVQGFRAGEEDVEGRYMAQMDEVRGGRGARMARIAYAGS